jgi:hypothetical protein
MKPNLLGEIPSHARQTLIRAAGATALLSMLAFTSGCVVAVRPAPVATVYAEPQEIAVDSEPPPPITEYVGVSPGPGYFWIGGYYHWSGARWVWYRGHYELPPHPGARWFGPRYEFRGGRRVYIRGYWR